MGGPVHSGTGTVLLITIQVPQPEINMMLSHDNGNKYVIENQNKSIFFVSIHFIYIAMVNEGHMQYYHILWVITFYNRENK